MSVMDKTIKEGSRAQEGYGNQGYINDDRFDREGLAAAVVHAKAVITTKYFYYFE